MTEPAYTEQDLRERIEKLSEKFHAIYQAEAKRQGDIRHKDAYADLPENVKEFDRVLARFILDEFSHIRSEARAGMREACANACDENECANHGIEDCHEFDSQAIRSLPDLAADEAIERIKREARLEEAKWWRHLVIMHEESYFAVEGDKRIAALEGKETEHE